MKKSYTIGFSPFLRASRGASWGMLGGLGGLLGALGELLGSLECVQILHDKIFTIFEDI